MLPDTQYAKSGDVNIAYQVVGAGPVDIVLVPGWLSNLDVAWQEPTLAHFLRRLASFSRLIMFDKRGTGLSDRVSSMPGLELRMDDVRAVMDDLDCKAAIIAGSSEGGSMAALFAATYPDRTTALVLHASFARILWAPDYPIGRSLEDGHAGYMYVKENWGKAVGVEQRAPSLARDPMFREWWARMLRSSASPRAALDLMRMNGEIDIRAILPAIKVPTLLLHSVNDQEIPVESSRYMATQLPNATLVELSGIDHVPFGDDAERIADAIHEFVTGVPPEAEHDRVLATVLFTDIVGATEKADTLGDLRWAELLRNHHEIVRRELSRFRGTEIDTAGDGFLAGFDGPARAIRCALAVSAQVKMLGLEIRAGLHTGECERIGDKLAGIAVHVGARVAALAAASEVLVSSTVKDLVAGSALKTSRRASAAVPVGATVMFADKAEVRTNLTTKGDHSR